MKTEDERYQDLRELNARMGPADFFGKPRQTLEQLVKNHHWTKEDIGASYTASRMLLTAEGEGFVYEAVAAEAAEPATEAVPSTPPTPQAPQPPVYAINPGILTAIQRERIRQDAQWGGPSHDDEHRVEDWLNYIDNQTRSMDILNPHDVHSRFVKIAALAVAAIESLARKAEAQEST